MVSSNELSLDENKVEFGPSEPEIVEENDATNLMSSEVSVIIQITIVWILLMTKIMKLICLQRKKINVFYKLIVLKLTQNNIEDLAEPTLSIKVNVSLGVKSSAENSATEGKL